MNLFDKHAVKIGYVAFGLLFLFSGFSCFGQALPPPNDNYTNRTVLIGTDVSFSGTLADATVELDQGEVVPDFLRIFPAETVWWRWATIEPATVIIQILGSSKDAVGVDGVEVYELENVSTGNYIAGIPIDSQWPFLSFSFQAAAGKDYAIQLAGSDGATVNMRLVATTLPYILQQPKHLTVSVSDSALFTVLATGQKPFSYQWQFNGTNLPGETVGMLALDHVAISQAGAYRVWITNSGGATLSDTANLFVTPTDTSSVLSVLNPQASNQFAFALLGDVGRRYRIQSSTNLHDWFAEASFPSWFYDFASGSNLRSVVFDSTGTDSFALARSEQRKFLRTMPFHAVNETCNNNIKQIRFAQLLFLYDGHFPASSVSHTDLFPYLKNGQFPQCPSNGYYEIFSVHLNPRCNSGIHPFEEP